MPNKSSRSLRILVVEDDGNIRRIMKDLLSMSGHNVYVAADGETGLDYLQSDTFDLIITDLGLPGINGWDLARASKRYQIDVPIISISSWQGKEAEEKTREYGIDIAIWKPFRIDQVHQAIDSLCFGRN
jgi:DNA-binding response OmpR family regulator